MSHIKGFEIFLVEADGFAKDINIDQLLSYPDTETETLTYRKLLKKYQAQEWAGSVGDDLEAPCSSMTPSERLPYYDESDLKSVQWLIDNNWFPPEN